MNSEHAFFLFFGNLVSSESGEWRVRFKGDGDGDGDAWIVHSKNRHGLR